MSVARWWMLGFGVVWLVVGCTGNAAVPDLSTTTTTIVSTTPSSSSTSTTVIDGEAVLNGFVAAVTDPDAIGAADMTVTVDTAGLSVSSTGWMRFSGANSHTFTEVEFLDERSEEITADGDVFVKTGDGPWIAIGAANVDGGGTIEGSESDTIAFLSTLSSLEYADREAVDGVELHRLGTPADFEFDSAVLGLDIPADDITAFKQSFLVDDDGMPVRWDVRFEADTYNAMLGRDAAATFVVEFVFRDWGVYQRIEPPAHYSVLHESERFEYRAAYSSRWESVEEPPEGDDLGRDLFLGPLGDEIQVYMAPLDVAGVEPLNKWLGWFRDAFVENFDATFEESVVDVDVFGRPSLIQVFQYIDSDGEVVHGFYSVAQLSPDAVHEFLWYSGPMSSAGDLERFTEFLSTVEPTSSGAVSIDDLVVGMCFDDPVGFEADGYVTPVSCDESHDNEVFSWLDMPQDDWPGESVVDAWSVDACEVAFEAYTGEAYADSPLDYGSWYPLEPGWEAGDRSVVCFLWDYEFTQLVGSMKAGADA